MPNVKGMDRWARIGSVATAPGCLVTLFQADNAEAAEPEAGESWHYHAMVLLLWHHFVKSKGLCSLHISIHLLGRRTETNHVHMVGKLSINNY